DHLHQVIDHHRQVLAHLHPHLHPHRQKRKRVLAALVVYFSWRRESIGSALESISCCRRSSFMPRCDFLVSRICGGQSELLLQNQICTLFMQTRPFSSSYARRICRIDSPVSHYLISM